ncbi:Peroxisomal biogenesis factor 6, partial [Frankliniella fusca]
MSTSTMSSERSMQQALLSPLKAGLCFVKRSPSRNSEPGLASHRGLGLGLGGGGHRGRADRGGGMPPGAGARLRMRRGSSMTDLDRLGTAMTATLGATLTRVSSGADAADMDHHMDHLDHMDTGGRQSCCSSFGDLMNWKRFGDGVAAAGGGGGVGLRGGSSWSLATSDTLIARTVPLSTVTPRSTLPRRGQGQGRFWLEADAAREDFAALRSLSDLDSDSIDMIIRKSAECLATGLATGMASDPQAAQLVQQLAHLAEEDDKQLKNLTSSQRTERLARLLKSNQRARALLIPALS